MKLGFPEKYANAVARSLDSGVGIFLFGLLMLAVSGFLLFGPQTDWRETEAVISRIDEYYSTTAEGYEHDVYVDYAVNGHGYTDTLLGSYNSSMKPGGRITIEYDAADPSHIQDKGARAIPWVFLTVGLALAGFGGYRLYRYRSERQRG